MATIKGTIKVPRCWKRLIGEQFDFIEFDAKSQEIPEDWIEHMGGMTVQGHPEREVKDGEYGREIKKEDPEAYYNDRRVVVGETEVGEEVSLELLSGQGNYHGNWEILDKTGEDVCEGYAGHPWESFDVEHVPGEDGNNYEITLEWQGEDPYEE